MSPEFYPVDHQRVTPQPREPRCLTREIGPRRQTLPSCAAAAALACSSSPMSTNSSGASAATTLCHRWSVKPSGPTASIGSVAPPQRRDAVIASIRRPRASVRGSSVVAYVRFLGWPPVGDVQAHAEDQGEGRTGLGAIPEAQVGSRLGQAVRSFHSPI
jgi:hypothetical protein